VYAELLRVELLLHQGKIDEALLVAEQAARATNTAHLRAAALGWVARGLATKRCWSLAETTLREAIALAPNDQEVMLAQGRVALLLDRRLDARAAYERMARAGYARAAWGLALVAYLLGEFDIALAQLVHALAASDEWIGLLFLHAQIALATTNLEALEWMVAELGRRSPQAESLPAWREVLDKLRQQLAPAAAPRAQLTAFPITVQRREPLGAALASFRDTLQVSSVQEPLPQFLAASRSAARSTPPPRAPAPPSRPSSICRWSSATWGRTGRPGGSAAINPELDIG
jgi:tetratricopeptide (TPR) repeat protein